MIISEGVNYGKLQSVVINELKKAGFKHRLKKIIQKSGKDGKNIFGALLSNVPVCKVICCGNTLNVPVVVKEMCLLLTANAHIEGLFRKAGSQSRQKEIKRHLENGGHISEAQHHPVDIASLLKLFLRVLPEPLIGEDVQELLLRARIVTTPGEGSLRSLMHTLLLLPVLHVHLLHYVMETLNYIASKHKENLMDATNLAIIMTPSVMPLPNPQSSQRLDYHVAIVKMLIENSRLIGILSDELLHQIESPESEVNPGKVKKKRRSGSLNRMFSGLKKMVSGVNTPGPHKENARTPILSKSAAKRKIEHGGLSAKTRKNIKDRLPQKELSFTPLKMGVTERKRVRLSMMGGSSSSLAEEHCSNKYTDTSVSSEDLLTSSENLFSTHDTIDLSDNKLDSNKDYVKISKQEYEEIKNRVSAIEKRLSKEFTDSATQEPLHQVQTVYEQTLEEVAMLNCSSSEQLARRLSRELKIRPSDQNKIIRSPSARKIGSIRRRSKENVTKVVRHKSWNASTLSQATEDRFYPYVGIKQKPKRELPNNKTAKPVSNWNSSTSESSFNITLDSSNEKVNRYKPNMVNKFSPIHSENKEKRWKNAAAFFMEKTGEIDSRTVSGRPSVNKLRSQNAGAVLAKAKMFETGSDRLEKVQDRMAYAGFARRPRVPQRTKSLKCLQNRRPPEENSIPNGNSIEIKSVENIYINCHPRVLNQRSVPSIKVGQTQSIPAIKKPLIKSPMSLKSPAITTEMRKAPTPMKAHHTSPRRKSPRLKAQKARNEIIHRSQL